MVQGMGKSSLSRKLIRARESSGLTLAQACALMPNTLYGTLQHLEGRSKKFGKCLTCQVTNLVDQCWNSARRSEARAKAKRNSRKVPITDWTFDKDDLARYVIGVHGSLTEDEACVFVLSELEDMSTWAVGKGELKVDWGATAKNWLRKSLKDSASRQSGGRLTLPSKTSQAADRSRHYPSRRVRALERRRASCHHRLGHKGNSCRPTRDVDAEVTTV